MMNHVAKLSTDDGDGRAHPERVRLRLVPPDTDSAVDGGGDRWAAYRPPLPLLLLLSGPLVLALVVFGVPTWLRVGPLIVYIGLVPGLACIRLLRLSEHSMEVLLGVGLSLALGIAVAQLMLYLGVWSPTLGLATLVAFASVPAALELYRLLVRPVGEPAGSRS